MSIRSRKPQVAQMEVLPLFRKGGVLTTAEVKSTSNKKYHVSLGKKLTPVSNGQSIYYQITCSCHDKSSRNVFPDCKGNSRSAKRHDTVCKHCIAALIKRFELKGIKLSVCDNTYRNGKLATTAYQNAINLTNLGGQIVKLVSTQGQGVVWLVGKKQSSTAKMARPERVNLLRGKAEKGIE